MEKTVGTVDCWERGSGQVGEQKVLVRPMAVERVLAMVEAENLCVAEMLTVCSALHRTVVRAADADPFPCAVLVQATALSGEQVHSLSSVLTTEEPRQVATTVQLLVEESSPELWPVLERVLRRKDEARDAP